MITRTAISRILPDSAEVRSGCLVIGGCGTLGLAARFGTPLVLYDTEHLRRRCREALAAFPGGVSYAGKACPGISEVGDIVRSLVTGACGYFMALVRPPRPAPVVLTSGRRASAVLRRENPADILQLDVWYPPKEDS